MNCLRVDGTVQGPHKPSSEYPFHQALYAQRPDLKAIVHAHPPALVSFSIVRQIPDTTALPQVRHLCGSVGYAPYALPGSRQLGANIAAIFAEGHNAVLLENHGIVTGGTTLLEAFQRLETLDFCARTLIKARGMGTINIPSGELPAVQPLPEFVPDGYAPYECGKLIVEITKRAYHRQLMTSTEGVVSARVDENSFLITPDDIDRASLEIDDLVLIRDGKREQGKYPSRSVRLHQAIYERHPQIQSVITAQPPHATAFAISTAPFDTKTIPESYILLRYIPVISYGAGPEQTAAQISERVPVVLLQNDGILTIGNSVLQAFDRLEVAEFSARALIETATIGRLIPIGDNEIRDLEIAFALP
jgi:L-fuculose-phosphate aldolase